MNMYKSFIVGCFALALSFIPFTTSFAAAPPQRGTITFVNTDHTYTYKLISRNNVVIAQGTIRNAPASRSHPIGIYRFEISHGDGRIERGQFSLAVGQLILITADQSTTTITSAPGNTTMRVNSGGTVAYDQGSSSTITSPSVVTNQFGNASVGAVGQVTQADAAHGVGRVLQDRFIPITGDTATQHQGAPGLQVQHGTNGVGTTQRDYVGETYQVQHAVGNLMCVSVANARDFEMCSARNTTRVAGVIDENGDVIFNGVEQIKVIGTVRYGDKLVASSTPGYAMVNNNARFGTVIGTALGSFSGRSGLVTARISKG